jgi:hypothetical protein
MWQSRWAAAAPWFTQTLVTMAVFCVVWTLLGMLVMKFFVRQVPILTHAAILFWATLRVQIVVLAFISLCRVLGVPIGAISQVVGVLATCAVGWLVTHDLSRKYRVSKKFPAVGAKVMTTLVVFSLLIVIAVIVITGA